MSLILNTNVFWKALILQGKFDDDHSKGLKN